MTSAQLHADARATSRPVLAQDVCALDTRPFDFSEIREARNIRVLAIVATSSAAFLALVVITSIVALIVDGH